MSEAPPTGPSPSMGQVPFQEKKSIVIGDVLGTSFRILANNLLSFAVIAVVFHIPLIVLEIVAPESRAGVGFGHFTALGVAHELLQRVTAAALTAVLVFAVVKNLTGQKASFGEALSKGLSRLGSVFVLSIVLGILVGIGLVLLVVPGIIIACVTAVAVPVAVVEKRGLGDSLARSAFLTKGSRWQIFWLYVIFFLLAMLVVIPLAFIVAALPVIGIVLLAIVVIVIATLPAGIMQAVLYHRLRSIKEGTSVADLVKVFE